MGVVRTSFATKDPTGAARRLEETFRRVRIAPSDRDGFSMRHFAADGGRVALSSVRLDGAGEFDVDAGDRRVVVAQIVTGELLHPLADAAASVFRWSGDRATGRWRDARIGFVSVDRAALERRARVMSGDESLALRFVDRAPDPALLAVWKSAVQHLVKVFFAESDLRDNELVVADASEHVLGALLAVFPSTLPGTARPAVGAHTTTAVERVRRHIEEHYRDPLDLESLVSVARMSGRGLQAAFRREIGSTPSGYVRAVRLARARDALRRADPGAGATVEGIAHAHGFGDLSHFAAHYRRAYGESPSQTLRS